MFRTTLWENVSDTLRANSPWSWTYFQHVRYLLKFWVRILVLYLPTSQKSICRVLKCDTKLHERQRGHFTSKLVDSLSIRKLIIRPYCTDFTSEHSTYEYEYVTILSTLLVLNIAYSILLSPYCFHWRRKLMKISGSWNICRSSVYAVRRCCDAWDWSIPYRRATDFPQDNHRCLFRVGHLNRWRAWIPSWKISSSQAPIQIWIHSKRSWIVNLM